MRLEEREHELLWGDQLHITRALQSLETLYAIADIGSWRLIIEE